MTQKAIRVFFPLSFLTTEAKILLSNSFEGNSGHENSSVNEEEVEFTRKIFWGKFFVVAITSQNGTFFFFFFFAKDEPILTHHNHSKS